MLSNAENQQSLIHNLLSEVASEAYRKIIVETGFHFTTVREVSRWIEKHTASEFTAVGLNVKDLDAAHEILERNSLAQHCGLLLQDPLKFLQKQTWIDVAFLNSQNGLQYAVEEFRFAASAGASMILFIDYQTTGASAILEARRLGWSFEFQNPYSILRRPCR